MKFPNALIACIGSTKIALISLLFPISGWATVDYDRTRPMVMPETVKEDTITKEDVAKIAPTDLPPTDDEGVVLRSVADRSIQYWWNNSQFRYSRIGRVAAQAESKLRTDIKFQGEGLKPIEHHITIQFLAAQAIAKLEYTGWVKAVFKYYAREAKSETQISEKIWNNKDLILRHTTAAGEDMSALILRWNW